MTGLNSNHFIFHGQHFIGLWVYSSLLSCARWSAAAWCHVFVMRLSCSGGGLAAPPRRFLSRLVISYIFRFRRLGLLGSSCRCVLGCWPCWFVLWTIRRFHGGRWCLVAIMELHYSWSCRRICGRHFRIDDSEALNYNCVGHFLLPEMLALQVRSIDFSHQYWASHHSPVGQVFWPSSQADYYFEHFWLLASAVLLSYCFISFWILN